MCVNVLLKVTSPDFSTFVMYPLGERSPCGLWGHSHLWKSTLAFQQLLTQHWLSAVYSLRVYSREKGLCHRIHNKYCEAGLGQLTLLPSTLPLYTFSPSLIIWACCLCSRIGEAGTKREKLMFKPLAILRKDWASSDRSLFSLVSFETWNHIH